MCLPDIHSCVHSAGKCAGVTCGIPARRDSQAFCRTLQCTRHGGNPLVITGLCFAGKLKVRGQGVLPRQGLFILCIGLRLLGN
ncbi:uncharacterized protein BO72DRAFT_25250 [Aspergillus fijiensis CBS 313.89]|uniref:Uncharacterized protein n=1 Tax=Aspergillus fijiensis CBS 313.89 TaxID=1448319 RepID=A0A8G1RVY0_9EURO|nr:uncharacterized protein BO72DRAFT_25250 [Aspergillus fijiensis CBS 313.89]RAK79963.1 hypothetical protein BO72DRAFT_25250 [Aspergillus fijiensis CBS 313.89]